MANAYGPQSNQPRRALGRCRSAIDRFPLWRQTALLHEFEEAETRQSAIEMANVDACFALADCTAQLIAGDFRIGTAVVDFQQAIGLLKHCRNQLQEQLDEFNAV